MHVFKRLTSYSKISCIKGLVAVCLFAFVLPLIACEDTTPIAPRERQIYVEVQDDNHEGNGNTSYNPPTTNNPAANWILVAAGDTEKTTTLQGEIELGVLLFDNMGQSMAGEHVHFRIINPDQQAELSSQRSITNESGFAKVSFYAGNQLGDYEIEVMHDQANIPVRFDIEVLDLPSGSLTIRFDYQGPVSLDQLEVYLLEDSDYCDFAQYLVPPENVVLSESGLTVNNFFAIDPLPAGRRYSVLVRARSSINGTLAAGGCTDDLRVAEDENLEIGVSLLLLPLNPSGEYELINYFDFTDAIPGQVGQVIEGLVRFFGDQNNEREIGGLIFDVVEDLAREAAGSIGGLVVDLIRNWVEDDLNSLINRYIDEDGPQWIRDFFTIGQDLISVVSNMEVISQMNLSKARSDGTFDGSQNWVGLAFYWRLGCDEADSECGRYPFRMDDIVEGAEGVQLVFGQFEGRIHSYNQGIIHMHNMDLQYGRLILFVLNQIILPRIANGATSISEGLVNLANCSGFASRLTGGRDYLRLGGINIVSRSRIEGWCTSAMELTGSAAHYLLEGLEIDTRMDLQGEMVFVESNNDLLIDQITDGVWWGSLRTSEEAAPPFSGRFLGEAIDETVDMNEMLQD